MSPGLSCPRHRQFIRPRRQAALVCVALRLNSFAPFGARKEIRGRGIRQPARAGRHRPFSRETYCCCLDHRRRVGPDSVDRFRDAQRPRPHGYARWRRHRHSHARRAMPRFTRPSSRPMLGATAQRTGRSARLSMTLPAPQHVSSNSSGEASNIRESTLNMKGPASDEFRRIRSHVSCSRWNLRCRSACDQS